MRCCARYFRMDTNRIQHLHQFAMALRILFRLTEDPELLFERRRRNLVLTSRGIIRPHANHKAIMRELVYIQADSIGGKRQQSRVNDALFKQRKKLDRVTAFRSDFAIRKEGEMRAAYHLQ
jgi:hypothetical protein